VDLPRSCLGVTPQHIDRVGAQLTGGITGLQHQQHRHTQARYALADGQPKSVYQASKARQRMGRQPKAKSRPGAALNKALV
jgi:hypothetical protein